MKRNYPLFLIDRTKANSYPFDYVTCFDSTCGFVARTIHFKSDIQYNEFISAAHKVENSEITYVSFKLNSGGIVLVIEDYLYNFDLTNEIISRIKTLLKKGLKKYLHAEVDRTPHKDFSIENQILQQKLTIEYTKQNFESLIARSTKENAEYTLGLAEEILQTLIKFRDNQKYFIINQN